MDTVQNELLAGPVWIKGTELQTLITNTLEKNTFGDTLGEKSFSVIPLWTII